MTREKRLRVSSVGFAVLWTAWMAFESWPLDWPRLVILVICGALTGFGWHWLFGMWMRWHFKHQA